MISIETRLKTNMAPLLKPGDKVGPIQQAIFNKEIDISGSPSTMSKFRIDFIRYVHTSWPTRWKIDLKLFATTID